MTINYYVIFAQHTSEQQEESIVTIKKYFKKNKREFKKFIILDNSIRTSYFQELEKNIHLINGDNSAYEFSAWQKGLDILSQEVTENDIVLIANDSFHRNYGKAFIEDIKISKIENFKKNFIYGYADSYIEDVQLDQVISNTWIRTNFFISNIKSLRSIRKLVTIRYEEISEGKELINDPYNRFSKNYLQFLNEWLLSETPLKLMPKKWYKSQNLEDKNRKFLQRKAAAIINEHMLTANIRLNGGKVIKTNFLKNKLSYIKRLTIYKLKQIF